MRICADCGEWEDSHGPELGQINHPFRPLETAGKGEAVKHIWFHEVFKGTGWFGSGRYEFLERLAELESQGFEIFDVVLSHCTNNVEIIYRKPAGEDTSQ